MARRWRLSGSDRWSFSGRDAVATRDRQNRRRCTGGHNAVVDQETITFGELTLRPFTENDIPWVFEVSLDPAVQKFVEIPLPYRIEHAAHFVLEMAIGAWASRERAEFVVERAGGVRLGRVGLGLDGDGAAQIGYWMDPAARSRGVATEAVRMLCRWAFATLGLDLIEWRGGGGGGGAPRGWAAGGARGGGPRAGGRRAPPAAAGGPR